MSWKTISSRSVYKNKWMEITEDQVVTDFGKHLTYGVVHKEPFALIVPWDGNRLFLVGQYRYPVNEFSWEFPQGHLEHGNILETARKELQEETGLTASDIKEIVVFNLAPGHHSQKCHVFLATDLVEGSSELEESEEGMKTKKLTVAEFQKMIVRGDIKDGPTIAAFGIITARQLIPEEGNERFEKPASE